MTIAGWIIFGFIAFILFLVCFYIIATFENWQSAVISICGSILILAGVLFGLMWYFQNTASGQRAITDQKSNIGNGLERTVTVYTADGEIIAQYTGKIDIEGNDGGYVLFDYDGKRYTYYNCFVESVADIG